MTIKEIYEQVKTGKVSKNQARVMLKSTGAVKGDFPVRLTVRETKPGEKPGYSTQNNFKLSRNEVTFRL